LSSFNLFKISDIKISDQILRYQLEPKAIFEYENMGDEDSRKIFVGGTRDADEGMLENYFRNFGAVESVKVVYDRETNRPRGFGFVVFQDESSVAGVTAQDSHTLEDGTTVSARKSERRGGGGGGRGGYSRGGGGGRGGGGYGGGGYGSGGGGYGGGGYGSGGGGYQGGGGSGYGNY